MKRIFGAEAPTNSTQPQEHRIAPSDTALAIQHAWLRRCINKATPLQLGIAYWLSAALMMIALLMTPTLSGRRGMMNLTESWGALERVALWQRSLEWIPGMTHDGLFNSMPVVAIVWTFRIGMVSAFVLQGWAFWRVWGDADVAIWKWMVGPIGAHLILLLLVPTNADVFFYAMSGNIANEGANPYVDPLLNFAHDPFLPYNHWVEMTTVYGPFWTDINRILVRIGISDPVPTVLAFKLFIGLVAMGLVGLVYKLARYITGNRRLGTAAAVLVAWQPNMVFESTGQVHNDILMMLLATCGVALAIYGGIKALRGAIILVAASVMIKYLTLPLLGILGLIRISERRTGRGIPRIIGQWIVDGIAILMVFAAGFFPYWAGPDILTELFKEPGRLFSHPLWAVPYFAIDGILPGRLVNIYIETVRLSLQITTFALIGWAAFTLAKSLWLHAPEERQLVDDSESLPWWTGHLLVAFAVVITTLALVPVNSHPWYWTWPVVPIALLLSWQRSQRNDTLTATALPLWFWPYIAANGVLTIVYNTRIVHN